MDRVFRIPVKVVHSEPMVPSLSDGAPTAVEGPAEAPPVAAGDPAAVVPQPAADSAATGADGVDWRDRALRLQAEMENYRRRQQRLAQEQAAAERERLLCAFLRVVDDLERALAAPTGAGPELRQGVEMTHRAALQMLEREGVEAIEAEGRPFDPAWHEAVATVGQNGTSADPGTVVQVVETGYRLGGQLLRPAKVVVAI